jgi:hypothetical protein
MDKKLAERLETEERSKGDITGMTALRMLYTWVS